VRLSQASSVKSPDRNIWEDKQRHPTKRGTADVFEEYDMKVQRSHIIAATVGMLALVAFTTSADASPASGFTATTLGTGSLNPVKVRHDGVRLATKEVTDVRVQLVQIAPGGTSGWHHHPGVVMVVVSSGSVTFWDEHCNKTDYGPGLPNGATFIESGDEPGQVTSAGGATNYATYIVPKGNPSVYRIEDVAPGCATAQK
jgi:quercetin dioxygenase-like cupin family protein